MELQKIRKTYETRTQEEEGDTPKEYYKEQEHHDEDDDWKGWETEGKETKEVEQQKNIAAGKGWRDAY